MSGETITVTPDAVASVVVTPTSSIAVEVVQADVAGATVSVTPAQIVSIEVTSPPPVIVEVAQAGVKGDPGEPGGVDTWSYFATTWSEPPAVVGALAGGQVLSYDINGEVRFRFVPQPYDAAQDAFFASWDGVALSGPIVARG